VSTIAAAAAAGLAAAVLLLAGFLVAARALGARRRVRVRPLRDRWELELALYLAADEEPRPPSTLEERRVLREVALTALSDLRGSERARVTALLEATGIVGDAIAELRSRRPAVRRLGAETLAEARSPLGADALSAGVADRDRTVALACARGLAELGDESLLEPALAVVEEAASSGPGAAAELLLALGMRVPGVLPAAYARARSPELRRLVAAVVGELRLVEAAAVLRDALGSDDDELVARGAHGLGAIGDADAVPGLLALLRDAGRPLFVRVQAATALGAIGDPAATGVLAEALHDDAWLLRDRAAAALARLGVSGRSALAHAASEGDPHARAALA